MGTREPRVPRGRRRLLDVADAVLPNQLDSFDRDHFCPSAEARYRWGRQQEEALIADVQTVMASDPFELIQHNSDDRRYWWLTIEFTRPLPLLRWALTFGDTIHSYRVGLDHMMSEIARQASGGEPPNPKAVSFPVCRTEQGFTNWRRGLGIELEPIVWERIELMQPYATHTALRGLGNQLFLLARLNNDDKHRVVPVLALAESSAGLGGRAEPEGVDSTYQRVVPSNPCALAQRWAR